MKCIGVSTLIPIIFIFAILIFPRPIDLGIIRAINPCNTSSHYLRLVFAHSVKISGRIKSSSIGYNGLFYCEIHLSHKAVLLEVLLADISNVHAHGKSLQ